MTCRIRDGWSLARRSKSITNWFFYSVCTSALDVCRQLKSWKTGADCGTPGLHSKETVVKNKCCDVKCFLWPARLFLDTFVFAAVYFWCACCFNLSNKRGADDQARHRLMVVDLRIRTQPPAPPPLQPCFYLSPIKAFSLKLRFSLATDDKQGAGPITGTLSASVTTCSSHICVAVLRWAKGYSALRQKWTKRKWFHLTLLFRASIAGARLLLSLILWKGPLLLPCPNSRDFCPSIDPPSPPRPSRWGPLLRVG